MPPLACSAHETHSAKRFAGYAAIFTQPDNSGDVIVSGAFARTLEQARQPPLILWQHAPSEPVGRVTRVVEDRLGLYIDGIIIAGCQRGQDAWALMCAGVLQGLSIGYRVKKARVDPRLKLRFLHEIELLEISLVTFPMHPLARLRPLLE
jgi:uncharacterized protein